MGGSRVIANRNREHDDDVWTQHFRSIDFFVLVVDQDLGEVWGMNFERMGHPNLRECFVWKIDEHGNGD